MERDGVCSTIRNTLRVPVDTDIRHRENVFGFSRAVAASLELMHMLAMARRPVWRRESLYFQIYHFKTGDLERENTHHPAMRLASFRASCIHGDASGCGAHKSTCYGRTVTGSRRGWSAKIRRVGHKLRLANVWR